MIWTTYVALTALNKEREGYDAIIYIKCRLIPGFSPFLCWSFTSLSEPHYSLQRASATVTTLKPSCWCVPWCVPVLVFVCFLSPGQKFQNSFHAERISDGRMGHLAFGFVRVCAFVLDTSFCMLEARRLLRPLGDRWSNEDVWLLQNPSAGIFLLSFTPSLSSQHTSSHF